VTDAPTRRAPAGSFAPRAPVAIPRCFANFERAGLGRILQLSSRVRPTASRATVLGPGLRLGKLFGFEINLDFSLILVFGLVLFNLGLGVLPAWHPDWTPGLRWAVAVAAAVLFFASILAHELAHAIVGRALGTPVSGITLFMFGGMAHLEREPSRASSELWMAAVGPLTSLMIGIGATFLGGFLASSAGAPDDPLLLMREVGPVATLLLWLGPLNIVLALFNMLPGFPLDGGRVLRALWWWKTGDLRRATRVAAMGGLLLAWTMIATGLLMAFGLRVPLLGQGLGSGLWLAVLGWFLSGAARSSYTSLVAKEALEHVAVGELMWTHPEVVDPADSVERVVREKVAHGDQQVFPVLRGGQMLGAVTVRQISEVPYAARAATPVERVMTPSRELDLVSPTTDAARAVTLLGTTEAPELPVVEGLELRGLLRQKDLLRWLSLHADPLHAR
jgi:Zn-dependent protease/CBS domain-containing protein